MNYNLGVISFFFSYTFVKGDLNSYITGGKYAEYSKYPHSVFLFLHCTHQYRCGGSILNQDLVLTAGHCFMHCQRLKGETVCVKYGHEEIEQMHGTKMKDFLVHPKFELSQMLNDICLVLAQESIPLNSVVKRVILMKSPPVYRNGFLAGWGLDENNQMQPSLKDAIQLIHKMQVCQEWGMDASGTFCAGPLHGLGTADQGDSGSALVVQNYIQIGLVSYRKPTKSSLVAYTNVSLFIDWIEKAARTIVCRDKNKIIPLYPNKKQENSE